jgi:hypothetical protein
MPVLKPIQLRERAELEPLVESNPDAVEDGLVILARQLETDTGPLDVLAVDGSGAAVVIELKVEPDDGHLTQGLRYYDWVSTNIAWISKVYPQIDGKSTPRLMLIAPEFSDTVRRIAKYVNFGDELSTPELIEYTALVLPDGSRSLFCKPLEVGAIPVVPEVPSIEEKSRRFQTDELRSLLKKVLTDLSTAGAQVRPIHGEWLSVWCREKRFMYLGCKKRFVVANLQRHDTSWTGRVRIHSESEWQAFLAESVQPTIAALSAAGGG